MSPPPPITTQERALLDLLRREPNLVENLRRCTAALPHEVSMLERLRLQLIRAVGAQHHTTTTEDDRP